MNALFRRQSRVPRALTVAAVCVMAAYGFTQSATAGAAERPIGAELGGLRLIDYFPSNNGWGAMWKNWEPSRVAADFARISDLNANAVRIIVNASALGFPTPAPEMEARLVQTVQMAAAHGLRVELTLFDGWKQYRAIAESEEWVRQVLTPLAGSPEIVYIDLHNELPVVANRYARAWAEALLPYAKYVAGSIPVTISASISSGVSTLRALRTTLAATPPDLFDVHYYGNAADAYPVLAEARSLAAAVPLIVGETGFATSASYGWARGLASGAASLESYQDYYYRMVESATASLGLPRAAPWILYDMPGQTGTTWGEHMGILHADGSAKPAAESLSSIFAGAAPLVSFNNGFEEGVSEPAIWRRWMPTASSFAIDRTVSHSGVASARMSDSAGNHMIGCPAFYAAPIATIVPGVKYSAGVWARGTGSQGSSRIVLAWSNSSGRFIASTASGSLAQGNSAWTHLDVTATPPPGATAVEIELQVCEDPGTTWFDDVSFSPTAGVSKLRVKRH